MWLINTDTLNLEFVYNADDRKYAILSHTWGEDEPTFQEMQSSFVSEKKGYKKMMRFCREALRDGSKYAWVDTCCIDKSSSAELTEGINSMFTWYKQSSMCYVYLADVDWFDFRRSDPHRALQHSRWFTRGWTLQELIAPKKIVFYAKDWRYIGSKVDLLESLVAITGIGHAALLDSDVLDRFTVAERMSWAARRETTRIEDMAYSLLGIFGVNMPLLYGEGRRAFRRLQEHIISSIEDLSIFAWQTWVVPAPFTSMLAHEPACFRVAPDARWSYADLRPVPSYPASWNRVLVQGSSVNHLRIEPPSVTSRGIRMTIPVVQLDDKTRAGLLSPIGRRNERGSLWLCLPLQILPQSVGSIAWREHGALAVEFIPDDDSPLITVIFGDAKTGWRN